MKRIGVLSDTHGVVPSQVYTFFKDVDEIWHAGDMGHGVLEELREFKPIHAVYGNMDDYKMRYEVMGTDIFHCEGLKVIMTHIGGWPGHYPAPILQLLKSERPDIFVCGHSHILKVMWDKELNLLHINPGAAGRQGFQKVDTLVRFTIDGTPKDMEILDFPKYFND
jgi:putative phosphoesterase